MGVKTVAEIGINHNGDINIAKDLIRLSSYYGFDYVKIQKRTPDICVPEDQKHKRKETPWGEMSYIDYKHQLEFSEDQIKELVEYSSRYGLEFFASVWDRPSVDLMSRYTRIGKIPSALIVDLELCAYAKMQFETLIISTGMSTEQQIRECVIACNPDVIMHSNSTYPTPVSELNMRYISWLKQTYPDKAIGYSGHEKGIFPTLGSVALGVQWIERHVTMDKKMWGSDQKSSLDTSEMHDLIQGIREIEQSLQQEPGPRQITLSEKEKMRTLRK